MRSGPRPSSSRRQSGEGVTSTRTGSSFNPSDIELPHYLPASESPSNASPDQLFSSFVALAAAVHTSESLEQSNALENLVNKDLGVSNLHTRYIGSGISFSVRAWRQPLPERSLAIKSAMPSDERFTDRDEKQRLADVILELRALTHSALRSHPNIVEFLGLAWETDSFDQVRKWPVLVLEYANGGTLFDLLQTKVLDSRGKLNICLDIASGISALHGCGIVHGDLKPPNILMFSHGTVADLEHIWIAKIGDFGGAILDVHDGVLTSLRTPTQPWNAPEWRDKLSVLDLMKTDVYSLGLVFWSIAADGVDPFTHNAREFDLFPYLTNPRDRYPIIERLKADGQNFLDKLLLAGCCSFPPDLDAGVVRYILSQTVQSDPNQRNLSYVVRYLTEITGVVKISANPPKNEDTKEFRVTDARQETLENRLANPSEVDTLDPEIRSYVIKRLQHTAKSGPEELQRSSAAFNLAVEAIDRENDPKAVDDCLSWLVCAANMNHRLAQALVHRFYIAFEVQIEAPLLAKMKAWTLEAALSGYYSAQEELSLLLSSEEYDDFKVRYRTRYAGIGRNRFASSYKDISASLQEWDLRLSARVQKTLEAGYNEGDFKMNNEGDTIFHFAASAGFLSTVSVCASTRPIDINSRGQNGETPLLHTCRSGHYEVGIALLDLGADPRIASDNGDTPLHWLLSFDANKAEAIATALCSKGANPDAPARRYSFLSAPELDYEAGTPLHRAVQRGSISAVRALLHIGASAIDKGGRSDGYTPLHLAALLHYPQCLDALLNSLSEPLPARLVLGRTSLLIPAINGEISYGRSFQKIARHGSFWWGRAKTCLDMLLAKGAAEHLHRMPKDSIGYYSSALFIAIGYGDIRVIRYLLEHGAKSDINTECRLRSDHTPSTPLHRSITLRRGEPFELLLANGADATALHTDENGNQLTYLYECASSGHSNSAFAELLTSHGVLVDQRPPLYETPFACAVRNRCFNLASYFLQRGADPHVEFSKGFMCELEFPRSLLAFLIMEQSLSALTCIDYLFENVAKLGSQGGPSFIASTSRNTTVLHQVAGIPEHGRDDLACKLILQRLFDFFDPSEAQVNQLDVNGFTALTHAVIKGNLDVATALLDRGADPLAEGAECSSALYYLQYLLMMIGKDGEFLENEIVNELDPRPRDLQISRAKRRREEIRDRFKEKVPSDEWFEFR